MPNDEQVPGERVDLRKYAAVCLALGLARGALLDALSGNTDDIQHILDITSASKIAAAIGCTENDLAIDWGEYLTQSEVNRINAW